MREIAAAVAGPVGRLGGAFMASREAKAYSAETGLTGWTPYFRGRFGVLGEVDADVVASAAGFFPLETVRQAWEAGAGLPAATAADRYAAVAHDFGRRTLADFAESARLADLLKLVADGADVVGAPLFGGWRAMPLPEDDRARVIHLAHVVRELRGGLHIVAVLASGLSPWRRSSAASRRSSPTANRTPSTSAGRARTPRSPKTYADGTTTPNGSPTN
ncbi:hypothetical protein ACFQHO_48620 [Actinomadura yumaensis]|uniref:SCO6745 family protein n=1 Tax=Actinomadura yumaensis TaxID=111807 RepID=UPI00361E6E44